tara:strand:- start:15658 stop:15831 length:174 start_codon:yes stop_codon:yes gene_type:complete
VKRFGNDVKTYCNQIKIAVSWVILGIRIQKRNEKGLGVMSLKIVTDKLASYCAVKNN